MQKVLSDYRVCKTPKLDGGFMTEINSSTSGLHTLGGIAEIKALIASGVPNASMLQSAENITFRVNNKATQEFLRQAGLRRWVDFWRPDNGGWVIGTAIRPTTTIETLNDLIKNLEQAVSCRLAQHNQYRSTALTPNDNNHKYMLAKMKECLDELLLIRDRRLYETSGAYATDYALLFFLNGSEVAYTRWGNIWHDKDLIVRIHSNCEALVTNFNLPSGLNLVNLALSCKPRIETPMFKEIMRDRTRILGDLKLEYTTINSALEADIELMKLIVRACWPYNCKSFDFDSPVTSNMHIWKTRLIDQIIEIMRQKKITCTITTHELEDIWKSADKALEFHPGNIFDEQWKQAIDIRGCKLNRLMRCIETWCT